MEETLPGFKTATNADTAPRIRATLSTPQPVSTASPNQLDLPAFLRRNR
jgi:hypothetical protein